MEKRLRPQAHRRRRSQGRGQAASHRPGDARLHHRRRPPGTHHHLPGPRTAPHLGPPRHGRRAPRPHLHLTGERPRARKANAAAAARSRAA
ncbi:hypothetical protein E1266_11125 [Actinomadura sp. 7K534]|nr:hypothetical protein E1266_11125 [Actinomadura sp. 7K534]